MVRFVLLACLLGTIASCRTQFPAQRVEVADPGPPQRVLPTMQVLDAGMTPRTPLRYRVSPGQRETVVLELARAQVMQSGTQGAQSGMPPVQLQVELGPAEPTPQGFIRHPLAIKELRLSRAADQMSPAQREQLEKSLAPLLEVEGWSEMDVQGRIRRAEFQGIDAVSPDLVAMLGNIRTALLTIPFPDEPLGVRGRWEVARKIQIAGMWVDQVVTYHIERIQDGQLGLQITARQTAEPQNTEFGRLEAFQSSVIGSARVRLSHFTSFSEAEATNQMRISTRTAAGGSDLLRIERRTAVKLYPADEAEGPKPLEPEQEPVDPDDAKVITDPGKQKLKWHQP